MAHARRAYFALLRQPAPQQSLEFGAYCGTLLFFAHQRSPEHRLCARRVAADGEGVLRWSLNEVSRVSDGEHAREWFLRLFALGWRVCGWARVYGRRVMFVGLGRGMEFPGSFEQHALNSRHVCASDVCLVCDTVGG